RFFRVSVSALSRSIPVERDHLPLTGDVDPGNDLSCPFHPRACLSTYADNSSGVNFRRLPTSTKRSRPALISETRVGRDIPSLRHASRWETNRGTAIGLGSWHCGRASSLTALLALASELLN